MRLRKEQSVEFPSLDETELAALQTFKAALVKQPVLTLPNVNGHLTLDTKACDAQIECVLLQKQPDNTLKHIGYWSRSLNDVERKYDTT